MGFLVRWLFALILLAATYNPTQYNYVRFSMANWDSNTSIVVLLGLLLLVGFIIYVRATLRSIGLAGMILILALVAAIVWVAYDQGWVSLQNPSANTWLGLFAMSLVLGVGLSWSIIRKKLSGQIDMDDVDE
ncbi:DUF6524 family protein [Pelagovum pacificum]|uniref:Uncharacterized protein n=1 Tax=Pelagovum pacificum TaxID=2588711 RepID=A0A5C5G9L2_9RHOB|nr:DUF6524 family protein [Pelagovum pacificum]QQA41855.1 hypothetical protein I8N54_13755 [Pelagovum pacificum]TNY30702.1 hypothetical protein FHY64_19175 [Pelagovum pacificum]